VLNKVQYSLSNSVSVTAETKNVVSAAVSVTGKSGFDRSLLQIKKLTKLIEIRTTQCECEVSSLHTYTGDNVNGELLFLA